MKQALLGSVLFLTFHVLQAQDLITTIPLVNSYVKNLQAYALGDSLFLSYLDKSTEDVVFKTLFVLSDGSQRSVKVPELKSELVLGVVSSLDSIYFYYLYEFKKSVSIKAIVLSKATGKRRMPGWSLKLPGDIIGSFLNEDLSILYTQNQSLHLISLHGLAVVCEQSYKVPSVFFNYNLNSVSIIQKGEDIKPAEAEASTKIYFNENQIIFGIDDKRASSEHPRKRTIFYRMDSIGRYDSTFIPHDSGKKFSTYNYEKFIYKIEKDNGFHISVYDWDGKSITSFTINKQSPFKDDIAYLRDAKATKVFNDRNVWDAIANGGEPFISVHPADSGELILKVGTNTKVKDGVPIPVVGGFGALVTLLSSMAAIGSYAVADTENVDHYFYLKGTPETGFTYTNSSGVIDQTLDLYELFLKENGKPTGFKYKAYLKGKNYTYAIYQLTKGAKELKILKFSE